MKRILILGCLILICVGIGNSQTLSEIMKGNETLTEIFVNPLGIKNAVDENNFKSLIADMDKLWLEYRSLNLGNYGNAISVNPSDLNIGGVAVENLTILVQENMNGILYQSVSCDNYMDMYDFLEKSLQGFSKMSEKSLIPDLNINIYMLSDKYGIAINAINEHNTIMAMLMDMRNLKGFIGMGTSSE